MNGSDPVQEKGWLARQGEADEAGEMCKEQAVP